MCEDTVEYRKRIAGLEQELMAAQAHQIHDARTKHVHTN